VPGLPTGTITFLFTDIEGSTRLLQALGDRYAAVLEDQRQLLRQAFAPAGGHEVGTQGDGLFAVFRSARDAVGAAVAAQAFMRAHPWPGDVEVRVRMGLHTGEGTLMGDDYVGLDVHRAARITAVGYGGQILLSQATRTLIDHDVPAGTTVRDLGLHRLKDLQRPEHLYQVVHPDLTADFPPLRSLDALPHNLPIQLTGFIGRVADIAEVKRLLASARLLTLLGPGGAGKTRLALQVAADCLDLLTDGVWLVELAPIKDPGLVPQTVAQTLGLREPARAATDALLDFLRQKSLLLMLDNCEHVLTASADLSAVLLRACPQVRIVATSRETLGVAGEVTYHVPTLPLPDPQRIPTLEAVSQYAGIKLFVERAVLYRSDFRVTQDNIRAIAEICRQLDGIPLAIELAAARVKVLTVEQIAARLRDRFTLLAGGARMSLPHHQTLRATMDWSYELLSDAERALFRRLAAFVGGFTLETAERVCAGDGIETGEVLDLLTRLVDKSLVVVDLGAGREARYRLLETVRQYALDRLAASEEAARIRTLHRVVFLELARGAEAALQGPEQKVWLDRLEAEHDNLRAALDGARADGDLDAALELAGGLWWFWEVRGYWTEGRQWLTDALTRGGGASAALRVKALNAAASLALKQGDYKPALAMAQESLALSKELGDKRGTASCLVVLGIQACQLGDFKRAEALGGEGLSLSRETGDNWGTAWAQSILAFAAREEKDYARAGALLDDALAQMRGLGHRWGMALLLLQKGLLQRDLGRLDHATPLLEEAIELFRQLGDKAYIAYTQLNLGTVASTLHEYERASNLYRAALAVRRELKDRRGIATCLAALGCCAAGLRQFDRAAQLFGAAEALREAAGSTIPAYFKEEYDRQTAATAEVLGQAEFQAAWAAGRAMPPDAAIDFALATPAHA
jgi:predicted ATPase/class 3 adenylate cyclase